MQEVLESRENIYRPSHHLIFRALESIAAIQHDMKQYEDEELTRLQLVDRSRSSLEENDPQTLNAIQQLLRFYTENREWNEAAKYLQEEVDLWRRLDSEDSSGLLMALANLSATYACVGQWKLAAESMREILDDKVASLGEEHVDSFEARGLLDFFDSQIHSDASETDKQVE